MSARRARSAPPAAPRPAAARLPGGAWPALAALALLALLWACRGGLPGVAVADDYSFLARLAFHRPLDPLDSMGAAYYWRPLSRQLYFSAVGPWLLAAPAAAALLHAALLLALAAAVFLAARRPLGPPLAAALAAFPLLAEPARVLLAWPSGAQHLLAATLAALALHQAAAGRAPTAALAALAALLAHESAALALPALPLLAWRRAAGPRPVLAWSALALAVAAAWAIAYALALRHGVLLPAPSTALPWMALPALLARALAAVLNLEDLAAPWRGALLLGHLLLAAAAALLFARRRAARLRLARAAPLLAFAASAFLAGVLPLALLPDWNAWRAWIPSLALGLGATACLGLAAPPLAAGFVALRLAALLAAPPAPAVVEAEAPETVSHLSFVRLARLQRAVESTRRALLARHPALPAGADVRFWFAPRLIEVGFQDAAALRVWYGDSTLSWGKSRPYAAMATPPDAMIEFVEGTPWPALVDEREVIALVAEGARHMEASRFRAADSAFARAEAAHRHGRGAFLASIVQNRARAALNLDDVARADSINRACLRIYPADPDAWATEAVLGMIGGDWDRAARAVHTCLSINPGHVEGRRLAAALGRR